MSTQTDALVPYTKKGRPAAPASYPPYMDGELQRISTTLRDIVVALKALDARLTTLEG